MMSGSDDSDDGESRRVCAFSRRELFPDRILAGPKPPRGFFIDDADEGRTLAIIRRELTSRNETNLHRVEISERDGPVPYGRWRSRRRRRANGNRRNVLIAARQRWKIGRFGGLDRGI